MLCIYPLPLLAQSPKPPLVMGTATPPNKSERQYPRFPAGRSYIPMYVDVQCFASVADDLEAVCATSGS